MSAFTHNYHTHTSRCKHAQGTDREMVQAAIGVGIQVLGFADHSPYPGISPMAEGIRMPVSQTAEYFHSLTALAAEYADQIELHYGFEAEYLPGLFDGLLHHLEQFPCEYLILGQHFSEQDGWYYGIPTDNAAILNRYVDEVIAGMETKKFAYVAHPDLIRFTGDETERRKAFLRLCQAAKALDIPLEVNMLGLSEQRNYPSESFFRVAQEVGNTLILGADAHSPSAIGDAETMLRTRTWAEQFSLPITTSIRFTLMK